MPKANLGNLYLCSCTVRTPACKRSLCAATSRYEPLIDLTDPPLNVYSLSGEPLHDLFGFWKWLTRELILTA